MRRVDGRWKISDLSKGYQMVYLGGKNHINIVGVMMSADVVKFMKEFLAIDN